MGKRGRKKLTQEQRDKKAARNARRGREPKAQKDKTLPEAGDTTKRVPGEGGARKRGKRLWTP